MSKSAFDDDSIPSYEESIRSAPIQPSKRHGPLHQQLDETRLRRVHSILTTYVDPLLAEQGASGLYKTVFLLVPSNVTSLQDESKEDPYSSRKKPEVVGFSSSEAVKLVHLEGEEHTLEFWRQPSVMEELASSLKARMALSGHRIEEEPDPLSALSTMPTSDIQLPTTSASTKKSLFWGRSKKGSSSSSNTTASPDAVIVDRKLGWREENATRSGDKPLRRGEVRVRVQFKEVCLRVENALGLYENRRGPGICLSVEVGS